MRGGGIRRLRRAAQVGTVLAFLVIPLLNVREMYYFVGNMAAFNAGGIPLADPLAMFQVAVATFSVTEAMLVGAGLSLLLAVIMGPVFCSWLCPFGLLSETFHRDKKDRWAAETVSAKPFLARAAIVIAGLVSIFLFAPTPFLTQLSMPAWFTRFWQHAITHRDVLWPAVVLVPSVLLLEFAVGKRLWCRYLCPQSVLISLAGLALPTRLHVRFTRRKCTCPGSDQLCRKACSLGLNPKHTSHAQKVQCTNCGDCVDACNARGKALDLGFSRIANPSEKGQDLHGKP